MRVRSILLLGLLFFLGGCASLTSGPVARFEVSPPVIYAGDQVRFDGSTSYSDQALISYGWSFSDGGTGYGKEVDHTFPAPGVYSVTLTVTDSAGKHASVTQEVVVYARSGTELYTDDFSDGKEALSRWPLDPAWASESEGRIESVSGHGFVLHIKSGIDRWQRRYHAITLPPLRTGQRIVFSIAVKAAQNQDEHGFFIFPARKRLETLAGSLPYFRYSSEEGGAILCTPTASGDEVRHFLPFTPGVYLWYTYKFVFSPTGYQFYINDTLYWEEEKGMASLSAGGDWIILLGDESKIEACDAYYDDIAVRVEE